MSLLGINPYCLSLNHFVLYLCYVIEILLSHFNLSHLRNSDIFQFYIKIGFISACDI